MKFKSNIVPFQGSTIQPDFGSYTTGNSKIILNVRSFKDLKGDYDFKIDFSVKYNYGGTKDGVLKGSDYE